MKRMFGSRTNNTDKSKDQYVLGSSSNNNNNNNTNSNNNNGSNTNGGNTTTSTNNSQQPTTSSQPPPQNSSKQAPPRKGSRNMEISRPTSFRLLQSFATTDSNSSSSKSNGHPYSNGGESKKNSSSNGSSNTSSSASSTSATSNSQTSSSSSSSLSIVSSIDTQSLSSQGSVSGDVNITINDDHHSNGQQNMNSGERSESPNSITPQKLQIPSPKAMHHGRSPTSFNVPSLTSVLVQQGDKVHHRTKFNEISVRQLSPMSSRSPVKSPELELTEERLNKINEDFEAVLKSRAVKQYGMFIDICFSIFNPEYY
ncbi:predicted protein [Naegleria gruberi]|uniref:Predicted protein n=1 Tax=Naegleria gruberi TaxID=5762 RepID=D2VED7_NAEGR|nr:uncharacterized protein NAEGRDRAFT_79643 [Naegleria gruberi]EFC44782.1 predicted protein [Naegleria gruberi]|eukprot:XP_002677526.1 predicted protein [Naegleria gruberi strain NEG-M]